MSWNVSWQVDLGNVLVAVVTLAVIFASLWQTRYQTEHAKEIARREGEEKANERLVREIADFLFELSVASQSSLDEAQGARLSALRRAQYLQLYLSPQVEAEENIRDLVHEATFCLTGDGDDKRNHFAVESKLSAAVRNYTRRNV